ncbi:MAG: YggT family protein [Candidatus Gracilibacteria bacterium]|jgi:YggT family protein
MASIFLYIISGLAFFLRVLYWCIIIDVLLSWLSILGVRVIIGPLVSITQPLYAVVRKILPTTIGIIDITPIILILLLDVIATLGIPFLIKLIQY